MYLGQNPTARQSQNMMAEALLELMRHKPLQAINVKEICQRADVSRQTFYTLFKYKEAIIEWKLEMLFIEFEQRLNDNQSALEFCRLLIDMLTRQGEWLGLLYQNHLDEMITSRIQNHLSHLKAFQSKDYASAFFAGAFVSVLRQAFQNHELCDLDKLTAIVENLLNQPLL